MREHWQTFAALFGTVIAAAVGLGGLQLSWRRDKVTKEAGIATTTGDSIERIMAGFSGLNDAHVKEIERLEKKLDDEAEQCRREIEALDMKLQQVLSSITEKEDHS